MATPTVDSLLQPYGPVAPAFFPDDKAPPATGEGSLDDRLSTYIDRAVAKVASYPSGTFNNVDAGVEAYALYLTFDAAYDIRLANPANESTGDLGLGSTGYLKDQIVAIRDKALAYLRSFEAMVAAPAVPSGSSGSVQAIPVRIRW